MISVQEAKRIIDENVSSLHPTKVSLQEATGLVLAEDVYAAIDIPAFPQSSMDGYAIFFEGWKKHKRLKVIGEIAAGSSKETLNLRPENAVRIFTGAAVPPGVDTVIMQEKVRIENGELIIEDETLKQGTSVRAKGSEIKKGELALEKESVLTPAAIGFIAGIGINEVKVFPNPSICIIITGNELQQPGQSLQYGQVYESNSFSLVAVLKQLQMNNIQILYATDKPGIVTESLKNALGQSDIVLLTGGISVGDYDFVLQSASECGVQKLFHKVKQRPGKPLYFGKKENKIVFGLPGNPSSVLTCFYQYVIPALQKLTKRKIELQTVKIPLACSFQKTTSLTHFLKGFYNGKTAVALDAQESYRLSSFAKANCLIQIDEEKTSVKEGELVDVYLLPQ
jgi:molybdopterin molybdotransferase